MVGPDEMSEERQHYEQQMAHLRVKKPFVTALPIIVGNMRKAARELEALTKTKTECWWDP